MKKGSLFLFMFFLPITLLFAQNDSLPEVGVIHIGKKSGSYLYLKASLVFTVFAPDDEKVGKSYTDFVHATKTWKVLNGPTVFQPYPGAVRGDQAFDYTDYFTKEIPMETLHMEGEGPDTVFIRVDVKKNGKYYYKDLSKMTRIGQNVVVFDPRKNVYVVSEPHLWAMKSLKKIQHWIPAYREQAHVRSLRGVTVLRPEKESLHASGILCLIFSQTPFEK